MINNDGALLHTACMRAMRTHVIIYRSNKTTGYYNETCLLWLTYLVVVVVWGGGGGGGRAKNKDYTLIGHFVFSWLGLAGSLSPFMYFMSYMYTKGGLIGHFRKMVRKEPITNSYF